MLGLFFVAGAEDMVARAPALMRSNLSRDRWRAECRSGPRFFLGVVSIGGGRMWESPNGRLACAVDGWVMRGGDAGPEPLSDFARAIMEKSPYGPSGYHGEFTAVVVDTRAGQAVVVNDRFGKRPVYTHAGRGSIQVSSDIRGLFETGLAEAVLDKPYVSTLLRLNKVRPGQATIFSGIETLPPGSCVQVDFSARPRTRSQIYYRHSFDREEPLGNDWVEQLIVRIRSSVQRAMDRAPGAIGLTLSGGLDSRLLAAAAPADRRRDLVAASYGIDDSAEARIARRVGDAIGIDVPNVPIRPGDYLTLAAENPRKNEEYDIFVQAAQALPNRYLADRADYVMSGWDLDIGLRGLYVNDDVMKLADFGALPGEIFRKWGLFSRQELRRLLKPDYYSRYADSAEDSVNDALDGLPASTPLKRYLDFIFQYEKQRLLMLRSRFIRHELDTMTPFYDEDLQEMLATVPEHRRAGNRLFHEVFQRLSPELHRLTYQRTMLPGDVAPEYWDEGARLELEREKLYRTIYQQTGQLLEYKRYYSNFAQWLLADDQWRGFVERMFMSGDALLFEEIADRDGVRELIERDRRSATSQFSKIIHLISLELHLREYFA